MNDTPSGTQSSNGPSHQNRDGFNLTLNGSHYLEVLNKFHNYLQPKSYLEIGTNTGSSLDRVKCKTIAIDPNFILQSSATGQRPSTLFFQSTSDYFFENYDPQILLGDAIDIAFLDGLHEAEALLRDFSNTEKSCKNNSIIMLHDCIPTHESMLSRADNGGGWTGDVWKVVCILKEYRPKLKIFAFDAAPTGLICCTGLDPSSTVIEENYFDIWEKWSEIDIESYGFKKYIQECDIRSTKLIDSPEEMRRYFWL